MKQLYSVYRLFIMKQWLSIVLFLISSTVYIWIIQGLIGQDVLKVMGSIVLIVSVSFYMSVAEDPFSKSLELILATPIKLRNQQSMILLQAMVKSIIVFVCLNVVQRYLGLPLLIKGVFDLPIWVFVVSLNYLAYPIYLMLPTNQKIILLLVLVIIQICFGITILMYPISLVAFFCGLIVLFKLSLKQDILIERIIKRSVLS